MPFAVELYLDAQTEGLIRGVWKTINEAGISASMMGEGFYPHVTLGIANQLDSNGLWPALSTLAKVTCPFPLILSHIGVFPNAEGGVVFLGVTVSRPLVDLHAAFSEIFEQFAQEPWDHYRVGRWVPHCTVAFGLTPQGVNQAIQVCMPLGLPVQAHIEGVGVAEILPNQARTVFMHRLDTNDDS